MYEQYIAPLRMEDCAMMQENAVVVMLANAEQILLRNTDFRDELKKLVNLKSLSQGQYQHERLVLLVASLFMKYSPIFCLYESYARRHAEVLDLVTRRKEEDAETRKILEGLAKSAGGKEIGFFLIMPVQRVPRYMLLLQELAKRGVEPDSEAQGAVERALRIARKTALHVNESIRLYSGERKVRKIQERFTNGDFVAPGRAFLFETTAIKISKHNNRKEYTFLLFTDLLVYAEKKAIHGQYPFHALAVRDVPGPEGVCRVGIQGPDKAFTIEFKTQGERDEWKNAFERYVPRQREYHTGSLQTPRGLHQIWVAANHCYVCNKDLSGMFKGLYHCHRCGKVVCASHSKNRIENWRLRHDRERKLKDAEKKERVCDKCFQEVEAESLSSVGSTEGKHGSGGDSLSIISHGTLSAMDGRTDSVITSKSTMTSIPSAASSMSATSAHSRNVSVAGSNDTSSTSIPRPASGGVSANRRRNELYRVAVRFVDSERRYIDSMRQTARRLVRPTLYRSTNAEGAPPLNLHTALFFNAFLHIYWTHQRFLEDLRDRLEADEQQPLGEVFQQMGPILDIYKPYARYYASAMRSLRGEKWKEFVDRVESRLDASIESYFVQPVHRVKKYKPMLGELLEAAPKYQPDYPKIKEAFLMIDSASEFMTAAAGRHERTTSLGVGSDSKELKSILPSLNLGQFASKKHKRTGSVPVGLLSTIVEPSRGGRGGTVRSPTPPSRRGHRRATPSSSSLSGDSNSPALGNVTDLTLSKHRKHASLPGSESRVARRPAPRPPRAARATGIPARSSVSSTTTSATATPRTSMITSVGTPRSSISLQASPPRPPPRHSRSASSGVAPPLPIRPRPSVEINKRGNGMLQRPRPPVPSAPRPPPPPPRRDSHGSGRGSVASKHPPPPPRRDSANSGRESVARKLPPPPPRRTSRDGSTGPPPRKFPRARSSSAPARSVPPPPPPRRKN